MLRIIVIFSSAKAAEFLVAGVPALARALHSTLAVQPLDSPPPLLAIQGGGAPSAEALAECRRLCPSYIVELVDPSLLGEMPHAVFIEGESSQHPAAAAQAIAAAATGWECSAVRARHEARRLSESTSVELLRHAARRIVKATGKPGDGIVSRHLNRPISQGITRLFLELRGARPGHATALVALIAVIMLSCLLSGTKAGLLAGAGLFHLASVVDGVDGEMARTTFRSSRLGAMWDSLTDALTNFAFLVGLAANLVMQGNSFAAQAGAVAFGCLAAGMALLGWHASASGDKFTFDAVKHFIEARPNPVSRIVMWLTMRDFFALASFMAVAFGAASLLLNVFALVTSAWLIVALGVVALGAPLRRAAARQG